LMYDDHYKQESRFNPNIQPKDPLRSKPFMKNLRFALNKKLNPGH
jgi:hypothetical protein